MDIVGTLFGPLAGWVLGRLGRLRFRSSGWRFEYRHVGSGGFPFCNDDPSNARGAEYECQIEIFNDSDKATALHAFLVEFRLARKTLLSDKTFSVQHRTDERAFVPGVFSGAESVNLPARKWTMMRLRGNLSNYRTAAIRGRGGLTAYFVAHRPSGRRKRWRIADFDLKA